MLPLQPLKEDANKKRDYDARTFPKVRVTVLLMSRANILNCSTPRTTARINKVRVLREEDNNARIFADGTDISCPRLEYPMIYVIQTRSEGHSLKLVTGGVSPLTQNAGSHTTVTTRPYSSRMGEILNYCLRECQSQNAGVSKPVETLAQYVTRIMKEKKLRPKDVERRSGDEIDDAYVIKIMNGITTNPSISKTQALAQGLGVDEDELFRVARGLPLKANKSEAASCGLALYWLKL